MITEKILKEWRETVLEQQASGLQDAGVLGYESLLTLLNVAEDLREVRECAHLLSAVEGLEYISFPMNGKRYILRSDADDKAFRMELEAVQMAEEKIREAAIYYREQIALLAHGYPSNVEGALERLETALQTGEKGTGSDD